MHTPEIGGFNFFAWTRVVQEEVCSPRQSSNEIPLFSVAPLFLVQSSWESFCACSFLPHINRSISDNWQQSRRKWFLTPTAPCFGLGRKTLLLLFSFSPTLNRNFPATAWIPFQENKMRWNQQGYVPTCMTECVPGISSSPQRPAWDGNTVPSWPEKQCVFKLSQFSWQEDNFSFPSLAHDRNPCLLPKPHSLIYHLIYYSMWVP